MLKGDLYIWKNKTKYRIDAIWFLGNTPKTVDVINLTTNVKKDDIPYLEFEELVKEKKMKLIC